MTIAMLMTVLTVAVAGTAISADAFDAAESVDDPGAVSYADIAANSFEVTTYKRSDYLVYAPQCDVQWAFLFYVGTAMPTDNYDYIMRGIATAGIAVLVSDNPFADIMYKKTETAFDEYTDVKYFIGGHSQGGGAAVRRAVENYAVTAGVVLYSPMIVNDKTLAGTDMPTICFEAENDKVLQDEHKATAAGRMNEDCQFVMLKGANHMAYGNIGFGFDGELTVSAESVQEEVLQKTLAFMQRVIDAQAASR